MKCWLAMTPGPPLAFVVSVIFTMSNLRKPLVPSARANEKFAIAEDAKKKHQKDSPGELPAKNEAITNDAEIDRDEEAEGNLGDGLKRDSETLLLSVPGIPPTTPKLGNRAANCRLISKRAAMEQ